MAAPIPFSVSGFASPPKDQPDATAPFSQHLGRFFEKVDAGMQKADMSDLCSQISKASAAEAMLAPASRVSSLRVSRQELSWWRLICCNSSDPYTNLAITGLLSPHPSLSEVKKLRLLKMRSVLCFLISTALVSFVSNALPLPGAYDVNEFEARDLGDLVQLESRMFSSRRRNPVGPGGRHPEDVPGHPQHTRLFHPVRQGTYYETANYAYSHHDVNRHANQLMNALDLATTRNSNRQRKSERTYPKPTSGFRPTEVHRDPSRGHSIQYHYPMSATPGNAPHNPHTGRTSMRVGTDRLMAWRHPTDTHFNLGVSYHDPRLPIPPTSRNHPFSAATPQRGGPVRVGVVKAKKAFGRLLDKVRGRSH